MYKYTTFSTGSWCWWFVLWLCVAETVYLWVVHLVRRWSNYACLDCAAWWQATLPALPYGCQCKVARPGGIGLSSSPCPACHLHFHFHHILLSDWPKRLLLVGSSSWSACWTSLRSSWSACCCWCLRVWSCVPPFPRRLVGRPGVMGGRGIKCIRVHPLNMWSLVWCHIMVWHRWVCLAVCARVGVAFWLSNCLCSLALGCLCGLALGVCCPLGLSSLSSSPLLGALGLSVSWQCSSSIVSVCWVGLFGGCGVGVARWYTALSSFAACASAVSCQRGTASAEPSTCIGRTFLGLPCISQGIKQHLKHRWQEGYNP